MKPPSALSGNAPAGLEQTLLRHWEFIVATVLAGLFTALSVTTQPTWEDRAVRWDATEYVKIANDLLAGTEPTAAAPFVSRVGFPALAALLSPTDPVRGMTWLTLASGVLSVLLMWYWLRGFQMYPVVRLGLVAAFTLQFNGPLRFGIFFPTLTYCFFWIFLLTGLILFRHAAKRSHLTPLVITALLIVCFLGTLVRETMLIVPVSMLFAGRHANWESRRARIPYLVLVLTCILACLGAEAIAQVFTTQTNDYGFVSTAIQWLEAKTVLQLLAGLFLTFGPMLAVLFCSPRQTLSFWDENPEMPALILVATALAVVGGTNTELFWYWAAPAVFATIGVVISERRLVLLQPLPVILLLVAQLLAERAFWPMPRSLNSDAPPLVVFSPLGDADYLDLWSTFADAHILLRVVTWNLAFILVYFLTAQVLGRRTQSRPAAHVT